MGPTSGSRCAAPATPSCTTGSGASLGTHRAAGSVTAKGSGAQGDCGQRFRQPHTIT